MSKRQNNNTRQRKNGKVEKVPLKSCPVVGAHKGMYRRDPPDWKGTFPFFKRRKIFPFLELPTELRAEIYTLLLGDRTIHIDYPGCKCAQRFIDGQSYLCSATISDAEAFAQHGWRPDSVPLKLFFAIRHSKCTTSVAAALPLWMIGLCKQVYNEASLVPFQENCFTFAAPQSIGQFLQRLNALQQKALTHVGVFQTNAGTMWDAPSLTEPLKLPPYLNIKRLTIFIELCPANLNQKDGALAITNVAVQDRLVSRMSMLWSPKLEKVEVLINNTGIKSDNSYRCLSVDEVMAWTARIRQSLLPNSDRIDGDEQDDDLSETAELDHQLDELVSDSD